jgi:hypothetical protein
LFLLFAKILNTRLENFLFKRNIIRPEQIGFCKNKRTSDHMFVLKTLIEKYIQNNPKVLFSGTMNPFAQDEGKELVDKTKLNVLLKLFDRNEQSK